MKTSNNRNSIYFGLCSVLWPKANQQVYGSNPIKRSTMDVKRCHFHCILVVFPEQKKNPCNESQKRRTFLKRSDEKVVTWFCNILLSSSYSFFTYMNFLFLVFGRNVLFSSTPLSFGKRRSQ